MATVIKVRENQFEISDFLHSMPHISCVVEFSDNKAAVVNRTGAIDTNWDRRAISGVQAALIADTVR